MGCILNIFGDESFYDSLQINVGYISMEFFDLKLNELIYFSNIIFFICMLKI